MNFSYIPKFLSCFRRPGYLIIVMLTRSCIALWFHRATIELSSSREYHILFLFRMIEQNRSQALTLSKGQVLMSNHANTDALQCHRCNQC